MHSLTVMDFHWNGHNVFKGQAEDCQQCISLCEAEQYWNEIRWSITISWTWWEMSTVATYDFTVNNCLCVRDADVNINTFYLVSFYFTFSLKSTTVSPRWKQAWSSNNLRSRQITSVCDLTYSTAGFSYETFLTTAPTYYSSKLFIGHSTTLWRHHSVYVCWHVGDYGTEIAASVTQTKFLCVTEKLNKPVGISYHITSYHCLSTLSITEPLHNNVLEVKRSLSRHIHSCYDMIDTSQASQHCSVSVCLSVCITLLLWVAHSTQSTQ